MGSLIRDVCLAACLPLMVLHDAALRLTIEDGRVWLSAHDVTVSAILHAWHGVGGLVTVHAERLGDARVTLEIVGAPESAALETVLRSAPGYLLVHRAGPDKGRSAFERLIIAPASRTNAPGDMSLAGDARSGDASNAAASSLPAGLPPLLLDATRHTRARSDITR